MTPQRAKKVMSDSPGLVDFAIGLVIFVLNLPDGQVLFFLGDIGQEKLEKWLFLDKNYGLTRWEKCQFFDLLDFLFL